MSFCEQLPQPRYNKQGIKLFKKNFNGSNAFGTMKICSKQG